MTARVPSAPVSGMRYTSDRMHNGGQGSGVVHLLLRDRLGGPRLLLCERGPQACEVLFAGGRSR